MPRAETLLVRIEKKKIYEEGQFEEEQAAHRELVKKKLKALHDEIKEIMKGVYKIFGNDSDEVRRPLRLGARPRRADARGTAGHTSSAVALSCSDGVGPTRCCARGRT